MSRTSRLIPALVFACLLAACGEAGNNPVGPEGPSFDSGVGLIGGNKEGSDSTANNSTTAPPDTTTSGGVGLIGGN